MTQLDGLQAKFTRFSFFIFSILKSPYDPLFKLLNGKSWKSYALYVVDDLRSILEELLWPAGRICKGLMRWGVTKVHTWCFIRGYAYCSSCLTRPSDLPDWFCYKFEELRKYQRRNSLTLPQHNIVPTKGQRIDYSISSLSSPTSVPRVGAIHPE